MAGAGTGAGTPGADLVNPAAAADFNLAHRFLDPAPGFRTALLTPDGPVSYSELRTLVNRMGNVLRSIGVRRDDRVLISMRDGVEYVAAWYAAQRIGAVTVDVCTSLSAGEHQQIAGLVSPSLIVTDGDVLSSMRTASTCKLLVLDPPTRGLRADEHDLDALLLTASPDLDAVPVAPKDIALWKLTAGSTGRPKACRHAASSAWTSFEWFARGVLGLSPGDVVLAVPRLFSHWARDTTLLHALGAGATVVLTPEQPTPEILFELITRYRPTVLVNVPAMLRSMAEHPDAAWADLSSLRMCLTGGEQLGEGLREQWQEAFGIELLDCVGSAESFGAFICDRPGQVRPGSVGQVVAHYTATVTDEAGNPLPAGQIGVLQVTGDPVAIDYWQEPEKSTEAFPNRGTLRTGDLFSQDEDGFFYHHGRADDLPRIPAFFGSET